MGKASGFFILGLSLCLCMLAGGAGKWGLTWSCFYFKNTISAAEQKTDWKGWVEMKDHIGALAVVHVGMVEFDAGEALVEKIKGMGKRYRWRWVQTYFLRAVDSRDSRTRLSRLLISEPLLPRAVISVELLNFSVLPFLLKRKWWCLRG